MLKNVKKQLLFVNRLNLLPKFSEFVIWQEWVQRKLVFCLIWQLWYFIVWTLGLKASTSLLQSLHKVKETPDTASMVIVSVRLTAPVSPALTNSRSSICYHAFQTCLTKGWSERCAGNVSLGLTASQHMLYFGEVGL